MITIYDDTHEQDANFMIERINFLNEELRQKDRTIQELEAYVFWHKTQEDKWRTKYDVIKIRFKQILKEIEQLKASN